MKQAPDGSVRCFFLGRRFALSIAATEPCVPELTLEMV
jgi:hypothetical protein